MHANFTVRQHLRTNRRGAVGLCPDAQIGSREKARGVPDVLLEAAEVMGATAAGVVCSVEKKVLRVFSPWSRGHAAISFCWAAWFPHRCSLGAADAIGRICRPQGFSIPGEPVD